MAYQYLCQRSGLECLPVCGTRDGQPHWWNVVRCEGVWRHVDVSAGQERPSFLCTDGEMEGRYDWDRAKIPPCVETP